MKREQLVGVVNEKGKPFIRGMERWHHLFESNIGKHFVIDVYIIDPEQVEKHVWYIIKTILPKFRQGHLELGNALSPKEAYDDIIATCPVFYKDDKTMHQIFDWNRYKPHCDMTTFDLECAIEWLHKHCIDNFNIAIGNFKSLS